MGVSHFNKGDISIEEERGHFHRGATGAGAEFAEFAELGLSSLVRNVPILTSIEVSPFLRRRSRPFLFDLRIDGCGKVGNLFLVFHFSIA